MSNNLFRIVICDDEKIDRKQIKDMTMKICREEKFETEISCYETAKKLLEDLKNGKEYDLFLLDVMMPEQDGMELAKQLRSQKIKKNIVFISVNREMALQGYEVEAARYLAKPVDKEKLREAVRFCYEKFGNDRPILLPVNGSIRQVSPKDIYYIEIAGRKSRIWQEKEEWDTNLSFSELERMLKDQGFVRCYQSFLVNCRHVKNFRTSSMELTNGRSVPVSKHRVKQVRQFFFAYMKN